MKPKYNSFSMMWEVKALGKFSSYDEALEAIKNHKNEKERKRRRDNESEYVTVRLRKDIKARLEKMADDENITLSAMTRKLIEKGVNDYEGRNDAEITCAETFAAPYAGKS